MKARRNILVTHEEIARAGGVRAAVEEALSLAALRMTPRAMTVYEATGMAPTEADGAEISVQVAVRNEEELREAIAAGAEAVRLVGVSVEGGERLRMIARGLREDVKIEDGG